MTLVSRVQRVAVNVILLALAGCFSILSYWVVGNMLWPTTEFIDPVITSPQPAKVGSILDVRYKVIRHQACTLEISRLLERKEDSREFLLQFIVQSFQADNPPYLRPSGYRVQISPEITPGRYELYSRVRYYCNGLDWIWPRFKRMEAVKVEVVQ